MIHSHGLHEPELTTPPKTGAVSDLPAMKTPWGARSDLPGPQAFVTGCAFNAPGASAARGPIYVVQGLTHRKAVRRALHGAGYEVLFFPDIAHFMSFFADQDGGCLIIDTAPAKGAHFSAMPRGQFSSDLLPMIFMPLDDALRDTSGHLQDISLDPRSAGSDLLRCVKHAMQTANSNEHAKDVLADTGERLQALTTRQQQVLRLVMAGAASKNIAADLHISQRTVENHRAEITRRMGARSFAGLIRLVVTEELNCSGGASFAAVGDNQPDSGRQPNVG